MIVIIVTAIISPSGSGAESPAPALAWPVVQYLLYEIALSSSPFGALAVCWVLCCLRN